MPCWREVSVATKKRTNGGLKFEDKDRGGRFIPTPECQDRDKT